MSVAIIHDFVKYQIEWLTSHNDLEFEPVIEDAIVQMLKDTGKSFIYEQTAETSQIDHNADSSKMVCVDAISRQAAIDALDIAIERYDEIAEKYRKKADIERNDYMDMRDNAYEAQQLAQWLNELKYLREKIEQITIKPEPHWIPCSERLPEDGRCLVTRYDSVTNTCFSDILWYEKGVWWNRLCIGDFAVIAWMPLPEPYRGGDSNE